MSDEFGGGDIGSDVSSDLGDDTSSDMGEACDLGNDLDSSEIVISDITAFDIDSSSENLDSFNTFDNVEPVCDIEPFEVTDADDFDADFDANVESPDIVGLEPFIEEGNDLDGELQELTDGDILERHNLDNVNEAHDPDLVVESVPEVSAHIDSDDELGITEQELTSAAESWDELVLAPDASEESLIDEITEPQELNDSDVIAIEGTDGTELSQALSENQNNTDIPNSVEATSSEEYEGIGNNTDTGDLSQTRDTMQIEDEALDIQPLELDDPSSQIEGSESVQIIEPLDDTPTNNEVSEVSPPSNSQESSREHTDIEVEGITDSAIDEHTSLSNNGFGASGQEQIETLLREEIELLDELDYAPDSIEEKPLDSPLEILIDYEAVYEGLEEYDFDGIDCMSDMERVDSYLDSFTDDSWESHSLDDKKDAIESLKGYVQETIGITNPPDIVYYNEPNCSDYGGYNSQTNTLEINTYSLDRHGETPPGVNVAQEAADTVAHELWHAYQHQCADNPRSGTAGSIDYQRQFGLNNYIQPQHDVTGRCINFEDYQDQLVESEARAFADQFKGRLTEITRRSA